MINIAVVKYGTKFVWIDWRKTFCPSINTSNKILSWPRGRWGPAAPPAGGGDGLCTAGRGAGQGGTALHKVIKLGIVDALVYVSIILNIWVTLSDDFLKPLNGAYGPLLL